MKRGKGSSEWGKSLDMLKSRLDEGPGCQICTAGMVESNDPPEDHACACV